MLTDMLIGLNKGSFRSDLICEPTSAQMDALKKGSGNPISEMKQVNSSAGLAINFWRTYELCHPGVNVEFEWKKRKPLRWGEVANIDVVLKEDKTFTYIESKFLEPYYSVNDTPDESYFDTSKYTKNTKDSPYSWIGLFKEASSYKYYNVTQLCRHLLAISQDMWRLPFKYCDKKTCLWSITWDMPDSFIELFPKDVSNSLKERRSIIRDEAQQSEQLLNGFVNDHLHHNNFEYRALKYNDLIDELCGSEYQSIIENKYFL